LNIIPTTTGAAKAISLVIPDLKGKFDGYSLRVPTPTVSVVDFTAELDKETTTEELRQAFRDAAKQPRFKGILEAVDEPLVSMDFKGSSYSSSLTCPSPACSARIRATSSKSSPGTTTNGATPAAPPTSRR
jgi:glyceraldehyde 3-phosphate dehydrogenase